MVMRASKSWMWLLACLLVNAAARGEDTVDTAGRLERLAVGKGWINVSGDVRMPAKGWGKQSALATRNTRIVGEDKSTTWTGTLGEEFNAPVRVAQTHTERDGRQVFTIKAEALADADIEGVIFGIDLPAPLFAGGSFRTLGERFELPKELPQRYHLFTDTTGRLGFATPGNTAEVTVELGRPVHVLVQDGRKWGPQFTVMIFVQQGLMKKGETAELEILISASGTVDETPAETAVDATKMRYTFQGTGGNYCFNIESPVTRYTLTHLRPAWARTELSMELWEPKNDNDDPLKTDLDALARNDRPGTRLRRELELMRELNQKKIPYIASVWKLPAWMYTQPPSPDGGSRNIVPPERWPEMIESLGAYLLYAKQKYGVEPDMFSFNEANIGVRVLLTAEEHARLVKELGAHFEKLGLRTKMLLADATGARGTHVYALPATKDPEAMKYVAAVGVHSWGGASPQDYGAWADLAESLKLPLLIAEAGPDAQAWQGARFRTFNYAIQELVHYQELLLHARPQSILYWEYTDDYSLLDKDPKDKTKLKITPRFCFQKHWRDFIPPGSVALGSSSTHTDVLLTAFRTPAGADGKAGYSLHLSNAGWPRKVTITGIPPEVKTLSVVRTSQSELFKRLETINVDGKLELDLPGQSLTTLTTLPVQEAVGWVPLSDGLVFRLTVPKMKVAFGEEIRAVTEIRSTSAAVTTWKPGAADAAHCALELITPDGKRVPVPAVASQEVTLQPGEIHRLERAVSGGVTSTGNYALVALRDGVELTRADVEVSGAETTE